MDERELVVRSTGLCSKEQGESMTQRVLRQGILVSMFLGMFLAGFLCGSLRQQSANAQLQDVGKGLLEKAQGSGGVLGSVADLGSSIVEMQEHVNGLQKNLDTLKKVQSSLGGGK